MDGEYQETKVRYICHSRLMVTAVAALRGIRSRTFGEVLNELRLPIDKQDHLYYSLPQVAPLAWWAGLGSGESARHWPPAQRSPRHGPPGPGTHTPVTTCSSLGRAATDRHPRRRRAPSSPSHPAKLTHAPLSRCAGEGLGVRVLSDSREIPRSDPEGTTSTTCQPPRLPPSAFRPS